jgi:tubulin alpha
VCSFDHEPSVVDEIRRGPYQQLFHPETLINGKISAASYFIRGRMEYGRDFTDLYLDKIRKLAENCSGL